MAAFSRKTKICFIGSGLVGGSLSLALSREGFRIVAAASRTYASAQALAGRVEGCVACATAQEAADLADFAFVTTSDDAIAGVASEIAWRGGQGVAHCSGAASLDVLDGAVRQGAIAGAFHPLQAFSSVESGAESLPGTTFGIEGNPDMREFLGDVALAVGGNPIFLNSRDKPLYHLTGVMMGNLLTVQAAVAAQLWEKLGLTRAQGVTALAPMMRQVSINLSTSGVPGAVAGPYPRGDIGTVRKHLEALRDRAPEVLPLYCELALAGLPFALEKGTLKAERAAEIQSLLEQFKSEID